MVRLLAVLVLAGASVNAESLLETFGSAANQFQIEFVKIGNAGNGGDSWGQPNGVGSVGYIYNIGKFEISRDQINKANSAGNLGISMYDMSSLGGNGLNRPANGISWNEAAQFVNWLNTSRGFQAAYNFDANGNFLLWSSGQYLGNNQYRHKNAFYFLPSRDEWYKSAYGTQTGSWNQYPLANPHEYPESVSGGNAGIVYARNITAGPADVNDAGGLSAWGTMAQGGNVYEWMESARDGVNNSSTENREIRGGAWYGHSTGVLAKSSLTDGTPSDPNYNYLVNGFRVAMVPEPSSLSLLLAGGAVLMAGRRRR